MMQQQMLQFQQMSLTTAASTTTVTASNFKVPQPQPPIVPLKTTPEKASLPFTPSNSLLQQKSEPSIPFQPAPKISATVQPHPQLQQSNQPQKPNQQPQIPAPPQPFQPPSQQPPQPQMPVQQQQHNQQPHHQPGLPPQMPGLPPNFPSQLQKHNSLPAQNSDIQPMQGFSNFAGYNRTANEIANPYQLYQTDLDNPLVTKNPAIPNYQNIHEIKNSDDILVNPPLANPSVKTNYNKTYQQPAVPEEILALPDFIRPISAILPSWREFSKKRKFPQVISVTPFSADAEVPLVGEISYSNYKKIKYEEKGGKFLPEQINPAFLSNFGSFDLKVVDDVEDPLAQHQPGQPKPKKLETMTPKVPIHCFAFDISSLSQKSPETNFRVLEALKSQLKTEKSTIHFTLSCYEGNKCYFVTRFGRLLVEQIDEHDPEPYPVATLNEILFNNTELEWDSITTLGFKSISLCFKLGGTNCRSNLCQISKIIQATINQEEVNPELKNSGKVLFFHTSATLPLGLSDRDDKNKYGTKEELEMLAEDASSNYEKTGYYLGKDSLISINIFIG